MSDSPCMFACPCSIWIISQSNAPSLVFSCLLGGKPMTWQCCHDQVAVFYFIPAVVFLIFLFSSYDTEVSKNARIGMVSCFKVKRCETTWIYVISSYQLCQATLLPLSKFFEATWNLESFSTSGWKFQQYITCLQNQAKLPCGLR